MWKAQSAFYKFTRFVATLIYVMYLKIDRNPKENCMDSYWSAYCMLLFVVPCSVLLLIYSTCCKMGDCIIGKYEERVKNKLCNDFF